MKQFENIFRTIFVALICFFTSNNISAQDDLSQLDSVEIGLITCSPHDEIYSLFGHTALRLHDARNGIDCVFNYGVFNYAAPHFASRFVFGLTDYELGIAPTAPFCKYYQDWGCQVTEHVLNLTNQEKFNIYNALRTNYLPENRIYRYNFFYDNCSTRPRDIIERNLSGKIIYMPREDFSPTYRQMLHEHMTDHRWTAFGIDLLLGVKSDAKTTIREQEFLPENLRYDFDHAFIEHNGQKEPLVKERRQLVAPGIQTIEPSLPLTPTLCGIILLVISLIVLGYEYTKKKTLRWFDIMWMTITGIVGIVLFLMIFSEHPTTSLNLQILILNPLSLFFIWPVWKGRKTIWFTLSMVLTMAFFLGSYWQDYAEGMEFVALCLLLRYWKHHNDK